MEIRDGSHKIKYETSAVLFNHVVPPYVGYSVIEYIPRSNLECKHMLHKIHSNTCGGRGRSVKAIKIYEWYASVFR